MNQNLAIYSGRPMETTRVQGGMALNPFDTPGQTMQPTAVGQSEIARNEAAAKASLASDFYRRAQAAVSEQRAREVGAKADIAEDDRDSLGAPIPAPAAQPSYMQSTVASPATQEGQVPSVEASANPATIDPDVSRAVQELGPEGAAAALNFARVTTEQDFAALPRGAYFIDTADGQVYRKP